MEYGDFIGPINKLIAIGKETNRLLQRQLQSSGKSFIVTPSYAQGEYNFATLTVDGVAISEEISTTNLQDFEDYIAALNAEYSAYAEFFDAGQNKILVVPLLNLNKPVLSTRHAPLS